MKILIVEGSKMVREKLIRYLELENLFIEVLEANTVYEAVKIMKQKKIDIILFDIQLPEASGLDLIPFSRKMLHKPVLVLITNYKYPQYISIYENM
jgi:YesN/AraC family two-component response regulator